jgi:hypothetical protein
MRDPCGEVEAELGADPHARGLDLDRWRPQRAAGHREGELDLARLQPPVAHDARREIRHRRLVDVAAERVGNRQQRRQRIRRHPSISMPSIRIVPEPASAETMASKDLPVLLSVAVRPASPAIAPCGRSCAASAPSRRSCAENRPSPASLRNSPSPVSLPPLSRASRLAIATPSCPSRTPMRASCASSLPPSESRSTVRSTSAVIGTSTRCGRARSATAPWSRAPRRRTASR